MDQREMQTELSYPERKTLERGKSFARQVWETIAVSLFIVGCLLVAAWMRGTL